MKYVVLTLIFLISLSSKAQSSNCATQLQNLEIPRSVGFILSLASENKLTDVTVLKILADKELSVQDFNLKDVNETQKNSYMIAIGRALSEINANRLALKGMLVEKLKNANQAKQELAEVHKETKSIWHKPTLLQEGEGKELFQRRPKLESYHDPDKMFLSEGLHYQGKDIGYYSSKSFLSRVDDKVVGFSRDGNDLIEVIDNEGKIIYEQSKFMFSYKHGRYIDARTFHEIKAFKSVNGLKAALWVGTSMRQLVLFNLDGKLGRVIDLSDCTTTFQPVISAKGTLLGIKNGEPKTIYPSFIGKLFGKQPERVPGLVQIVDKENDTVLNTYTWSVSHTHVIRGTSNTYIIFSSSSSKESLIYDSLHNEFYISKIKFAGKLILVGDLYNSKGEPIFYLISESEKNSLIVWNVNQDKMDFFPTALSGALATDAKNLNDGEHVVAVSNGAELLTYHSQIGVLNADVPFVHEIIDIQEVDDRVYMEAKVWNVSGFYEHRVFELKGPRIK